MGSSTPSDEQLFLKDFACRLKEQRKAVNIQRAEKDMGKITQETIASELSVSTDTVKGWESGKFLPSLQNLVKLCVLLDCDSDFLLGLSSQAFQAPFKLQMDTGLSSRACAHIHNLQFLTTGYNGQKTAFSMKDVFDDLIADDRFLNFLGECYMYAMTNLHYLESRARSHTGLPEDQRHDKTVFRIEEGGYGPDTATINAQNAAKCHEMLALEHMKFLIENLGDFASPLLQEKFRLYFETNYHEANQAVRLRRSESVPYYIQADISESALLQELARMLDAATSLVNQKSRTVSPDVAAFMDMEFEHLMEKLFAIRSIDDEKAKSIGHRMANMIVRADAQETGFAKTPISRISEASGVGEYELFLPLRSEKEKS